MKRILPIIALVFFGMIAEDLKAQQDAMYTHYSFNTLGVNSGYAGSRDALTVTALHRSQWVGFDGAPTTETLTLHSPVFNDKVGLGLSIINDKIGPINNTSAYVDFAYRLKISEKAKLGFGLKGGVNFLQPQVAGLETDVAGDQALIGAQENQVLPNFGFGLYYHTTKWYVGLSTPKILENTLTTGGDVGVNKEVRHYFAIAGAIFDLNKTGSIKLKPTTFVKVTNGAPIEADLTALAVFNDALEAGLMYRTGDAVGILLGYDINKQFRIGYSFDWSFANTTGKYNAGSHEIMLRYDFIYGNKKRIESPRYF